MKIKIDKIAVKSLKQAIVVLLFALLWVACDQTTPELTQPAQNDAPKQMSTFNAEGIANLQAEMQDWRSKMPELLAKIKSRSQQSQEQRQALVTPAMRARAAEFKARYQARGRAIQDKKEEPAIEATQIYVPDDYATIQAAVDAAAPGDEIIIRDGEYFEEVSVLTDNLTLKAENFFGVTIFGGVGFQGVTGGKIDGIICFGDGSITFTGIIFVVESSGVAVKNCGIGYGLGIIIFVSNDCNVMDNIAVFNIPFDIINLGGISLAGSIGSLVSGNLTAVNGGSGITLLECFETNVKSNLCEENGDAGAPWPFEYNNGIIALGGGDNHYMKNEASGNVFCGMLLIESQNNKIGPTNTMNENGVLGLYLAGANDNVVQKNTALNNGDCDAIDEGTGNHYTKNDFGCTNF